MSKQLKCRPLSVSKINSILSQNPSAKSSPAAPLSVNTQSAAAQSITVQTEEKHALPKLITLKRSDDFDSLLPEENLKTFLSFARNVISRYEDDQRLQTEMETKTQDLMHYIELSKDMNACEGNKMYRKLLEVRRRRRACKNEIDLLKPLYDYLSDKTVINQLSKIQGLCRTSKETISQRQYTLRTDVME